MKRIYYNYQEWEDFKAGMYNIHKKRNEKELIKKASSLLKNNKLFYSVMFKVITKWKKATVMNMTNTSRNRQAWLGQASCCHKYKVPEYLTKLAWRTLTDKQREKANNTADTIIKEWERVYKYNIKSNLTYNFENYKKKLNEKEKREGNQTKLI